MADLKTFARRIRAIGRRVEENADAGAVQTALAVDQAVVVATPVDTGRARGNWQAQIGSPVREETNTTDKGGQATIDRNEGIIRSRRGTSEIYISNNVPYIGRLNEGSSSQAPENFVQIAVQAGVRAVHKLRLTR